MFEQISLKWKDVDYVIPSDKVMGLIECVEDVMTLEELNSDGVKRVKLSRAFAVALTYAGAKDVNIEEIYSSLFDRTKGAQVTAVVNNLLLMMIPPEHLREDASQGKKE